jgi:hypothetical protein
MNESDEFRQQVEELKQRLGATHAQNESQAGELSTWFATIKASLRSKQDEINRLTGENQQLRVMLDEVIALLNQRQDLNSGQIIRGFFDEIAEFIEEREAAETQAIEMPAAPEPSIGHEEQGQPAAPVSNDTPSPELSAKDDDVKDEDAKDEDDGNEVVPALKRILKRSQRGR